MHTKNNVKNDSIFYQIRTIPNFQKNENPLQKSKKKSNYIPQYILPTTYTYSRGIGRGTKRRKGRKGRKEEKREGKIVSVSFFLLAFLFLTSSFSLAFL